MARELKPREGLTVVYTNYGEWWTPDGRYVMRYDSRTNIYEITDLLTGREDHHSDVKFAFRRLGAMIETENEITLTLNANEVEAVVASLSLLPSTEHPGLARDALTKLRGALDKNRGIK